MFSIWLSTAHLSIFYTYTHSCSRFAKCRTILYVEPPPNGRVRWHEHKRVGILCATVQVTALNKCLSTPLLLLNVPQRCEKVAKCGIRCVCVAGGLCVHITTLSNLSLNRHRTRLMVEGELAHRPHYLQSQIHTMDGYMLVTFGECRNWCFVCVCVRVCTKFNAAIKTYFVLVPPFMPWTISRKGWTGWVASNGWRTQNTLSSVKWSREIV